LEPNQQHEVFGSLHSFLVLYAKKKGLPEAAAEDLFGRLRHETLEPAAGLDESWGDVPCLGQRIWSSDLKLRDVPVQPGFKLEVCTMLNDAIRSDYQDLLDAAMPLIRAINLLCVVLGARPDQQLRFPQESECFRGGGILNEWLEFFQEDLKYRVPSFLATSFSREVQDLLHKCK
jgi:hypothetical protein